MSPYSEIPGTPRAKRDLKYEDLVGEAASPASSSGRSVAGEHRHDDTNTPREVSSAHQRNESSVNAGALAPPVLGSEKGQMDKKKGASSPFLVPVDLGGLTASAFPNGHASDPTFLPLYPSTGCHSIVTKHHLCAKILRFWAVNRSYLLVIISTLFGSAMTLFTKILESGDDSMHPFQILFIRMAASAVACTAALYLWQPSEFPLGPNGVRQLLLMRGATGFFGIFGLWTAIEFLDLADATVITFLTPSMVAAYSAVFLKQPFTRKEQLASLLAMLGVVFIARPAMFFGTSSHVTSDMSVVSPVQGRKMRSPSPGGGDTIASDRLTGTMLAVMSAIGGAGAFVTIRAIGKKAHTFTTTSYFAIICAIFSGTTLAVAPLIGYGQPHLRFGLPHGQTQWVLMAAITVCGMGTQLLLTLGLGGETTSNKAPAMVYTGMLWTAGFDRWVFGTEMFWTSIVGCGLIVGGAAWIALEPRARVVSQSGGMTGSDLEGCAGVNDIESARGSVELAELAVADSSSDGFTGLNASSPQRRPG